MALRFRYDAAADTFEQAARDIEKPIARATTIAIRETAKVIRAKGRQDIATAGFSRRWQSGFRVDTKPDKGFAIDAEAFSYHRVPFADVFEAGARIRGKPLLWVPLSSTPKKIGRKKLTPKRFVREVGRLYSITNASRPLLGAAISVGAREKNSDNIRVTLAKLKRGAAARKSGTSGVAVRTVPLFVGVPAVSIRRRFGISEIIDAAVRDLPRMYARYIED